jgi:serine/threonine-protein kinase HipA
LYDVSSALPYTTAERKLRLAMKVGGTYDVHSRRDPWPTTAGDLALDSELPATLVDLVGKRASRCETLLART